jgi:hypothetical protein
VVQYLLPEGPDPLIVPFAYRDIALAVLGLVGGQGSALVHPPQAAAIHHLHIANPEQLKDPQRIGGPPVVLVAIEDDRGVLVDPLRAKQALEPIPIDVVADQLVIKIVGPVDLDCAGDVTGVVEQKVFVGLHQSDLGILEMLGHPIGRDECLRVGVPPLLDRCHCGD